MGQRISNTTRRQHNPSSLRFRTQFDPDSGRATVVRIVHAFRGPDLKDRNRYAKAVLRDVLKSWPHDLRTCYLITTGGFLSFDWPRQVSINDPGKAMPTDIRFLIKAAKNTCIAFLTPVLRARLAKVADYISLGADSEYHGDDGTVRTAELVLLFHLRSRRLWITGKSYPTGQQEHDLVRFNDLSTHLVRAGKDKVLLLGCHDLNLFSKRARKNCKKHGWRAKQMCAMEKSVLRFAPTVILQHPHSTPSSHTWGTALGGLTRLLHAEGVSDFTFAGAGRWYQSGAKTARLLRSCLRATARGQVATAVVRRLK